MPVSLVIPGRNCSATIAQCLDAVMPLHARGEIAEVIFVDDGSTDNTRAIVERYPVRILTGQGRGPAAARNLGWRAADSALIWFIDADCVAEDDALSLLLTHMSDPQLGGISGSYGNMCPDSLLACLIHEEIIARHERMPPRVNFLATFNVVYRRAALDAVDGFDERFLKGQDAELSWRVMAAGYELGFDIRSRVKHFHETALGQYLRIQRRQGYWRAWLHLTHKGHAAGDSYSSALDHVQPPLALLALAVTPTLLLPGLRCLPLALIAALALAQAPLTRKIIRRTGQWKLLAFAPMGMVRALWRGLGLAQGLFAWIARRCSS